MTMYILVTLVIFGYIACAWISYLFGSSVLHALDDRTTKSKAVNIIRCLFWFVGILWIIRDSKTDEVFK